MKSQQHLLLPLTVAVAVFGFVAWSAGHALIPSSAEVTDTDTQNVSTAANRVDAVLQAAWDAESIKPADAADELQVFRRLTLALVGAVPSIEEIRQFEADSSPHRLQQWTSRLIADSRFVDYFGARLGEAFVDSAEENLKPHQRERYSHWMGTSLQQGRSYSQIVQELIASRGISIDQPATTFVAMEIAQGDMAAQRLAARTSRGFLGQRIDCAQCHDHPFADWKQSQFEGMAAYFGQVQYRNGLLQDTRPRPFVIDADRKEEQRTVTPEVPFNPQWVPDNRHLRAELAEWITHPENRRFRRATANRVWGLMFGRAFIMPVDDLPDPSDSSPPDVLDILAEDLASHNDDLRHLIQVIASTQAFNLASTHPALDDATQCQQIEDSWAVFPLTELGPFQMIRSMQQAAAVETLRVEDSNQITAIRRYERQFRFASDYGVIDDSSDGQASTIPHMVQRLSGNFTRQYCDSGMFNAPGRIAAFSGSPEACLENSYLACLTRRPTPDEQAHFLSQLQGRYNRRANAVEDIYWTLFNSAEFCWNH